jgi:hypothetical protein
MAVRRPAGKTIIGSRYNQVFRREDGVCFVVVETYKDGSVGADSIAIDNPLYPLDGGWIDHITPAELADCEYLGDLVDVIARSGSAVAREIM